MNDYENQEINQNYAPQMQYAENPGRELKPTEVMGPDGTIHSMKWHRFMITVALYLSAVLNIFNGIKLFAPVDVSYYDPEIRSTIRALHMLDLFSGVMMLCLAAFAIITRKALANYQAKGVRMLLALYALPVILAIFLIIMVAVIAGTAAPQFITAAVSSAISAAVMIAIQHTYYKKRAFLFH